MFQAVRASFSLLTKREKVIIASMALANLALNILDIVAIALVGLVANVAVGGAIPGSLSWLPTTSDTLDLILFLLISAAGLFGVKTVAGIFVARWRALFLASLESYFSDQIMNELFYGGLSVLKSQSRSEIDWAVVRSTRIAFGQVLGLALQSFAEATLATAIVVLFFVVDWFSALTVLVYFGSVFLAFHVVSRRQLAAGGRQFKEGTVTVAQGLTDLLASYKEVKVGQKLPYFLEKISVARREVALSQARQSYFQAIPRLVVELGLIVGAIGFLILQISLNDGEPDLSVISVFLLGSLRMMSALLPLQRAVMQLRFEAPQAASAQRLIGSASTKDQTPTRIRETNVHIPNEGGLAVSLENVTFSFDDSLVTGPVVREVSLEVASGQVVAIIGPSGAGKTTLIDLILGLQSPTFGKITVGGFDPGTLRSWQPDLIGYVPQKPGLVSGSIRENIALGVQPSLIDDGLLWRAIELASLRPFVESLPDGVLANLGAHSDSLSGGQLQRIGLARALYSEPRLLVLDEATSALDAETESTIAQSLTKDQTDRTTIIVAHRLSTVQSADVVFVLEAGRVLAAGKLSDLKTRVPLVRHYIDLMSID